MAESRREDRIMKKVCVITGGGSGMGLATAHIMGKGHYIILVGRTVSKLENAVQELQAEGIEAEAFSADVGNRKSIEKLATHAAELGSVKALIHAAGLSPHMGDAKLIMQGNAMGTIYMNEVFYEVMGEGSCMIDVSSMSAYLTPQFIMPKAAYKYALTDQEKFMKKMMARVNMMPKSQRANVAYGVSKNFIIWYAKNVAVKMGEKGIRILSITPGNFETPMGKLEEKEATNYVKYCAIKRFGKPSEIAELMAFCASEKPGFLTGCDIICDGGCVASGVNPLMMK